MFQKSMVVLVATLLLFGSASVVSAESATGTATEATMKALLAQIEELQKKIADLQRENTKVATEVKELRSELKLMHHLRMGEEDDDVKVLQELLATDPEIYPEGKVTGYYGSLTHNAVKRLQKKMGLEQVGQVGPKTLEKLNKILEEGAGNSGVIPPGLLRVHGQLIAVNLSPVADSGVKGVASIRASDNGTTKVLIELRQRDGRESASSSRPAHIHVGSCKETGAVKYPLSSVAGGRSETILAASTSALLAELPLYVNVHQSADDHTAIACGDLKVPSIVWKNTDMDDKKKPDRDDDGDNEKKNSDATTREFKIEVSSYAFSQKELRVKKGDKVTIKVLNKNGFHDLVLDEFGIKTPQLTEGKSAEIKFVADKAGTFEYYCSVGEHRSHGMVGKLIVE